MFRHVGLGITTFTLNESLLVIRLKIHTLGVKEINDTAITGFLVSY